MIDQHEMHVDLVPGARVATHSDRSSVPVLDMVDRESPTSAADLTLLPHPSCRRSLTAHKAKNTRTMTDCRRVKGGSKIHRNETHFETLDKYHQPYVEFLL